ncbi:MAG: hypothetical protein AB7P07_10105 [Hyphomonadaceae bacterium]
MAKPAGPSAHPCATEAARLDAALSALEARLAVPAADPEETIAALAEPVRAFGAAAREARDG